MHTTTWSVHIIIISSSSSSSMSFLNISDPKKRDTVVNEYLALIKKIQQEKMNEKVGELARVENLKQVFDPVVQSTEKSTTAITKELAPLREEMRNLNENLIAEKTQMAGRKRKRDELSPPPPHADNVLQHYLHRSDKAKLDKYFGIQYTRHGNYMMGDKEVTVDKQSNIHVEGNTYKATVGLWALVMEAIPKENQYTNDDLNVYADLVQKTNILYYPPRNLTAHSRYKNTYKWKNILIPIRDWEYQQHSSHDHQGSSSSSSSSSSTITSSPTDENLVDGRGIQFLPTDIKGLTKKLHLLLAEFAAGNKTSTRNEIIFILDELLRRKKISRKEYTDINSYLSRCL